MGRRRRGRTRDLLPRDMRIVMFPVGLLDRFVQIRDLVEVNSGGLLVRLPQRPSARMPDVVPLDQGGRARLNGHWLDSSALLAIEVMSDDPLVRNLVEKRQENERAGIADYLVGDARPDHTGTTDLRLGTEGHYEAIEPGGPGPAPLNGTPRLLARGGMAGHGTGAEWRSARLSDGSGRLLTVSVVGNP